ncbi:hypothetical protein SNE25_02170 [Mucilaginibacter sabulilitoris]|uniref:Methyltransferase type 11 n=1 Tax=Mucilaginibacter sabulilitoris TaxID=1173583 RepID=A0ABZ0TPE6_9SPHI|nr:hypothetical protein [Mucilaginibacter sabulilitoris]WPU94327.1 hypothetical protein SNE25_02170 [Mucilaginibacter sabulilitoris]
MIEIFKTNVENERQAKKLIILLNRHFPSAEITFDLDDCDSILRVKDEKLCLLNIIKILKDKGFECRALE